METGKHTDIELLERYAMETLPEEVLAELEEHLLICSSCQERLAEAEDFVRVFRKVAPGLRVERPSPIEKLRFLWARIFVLPRPVWAGAFAVLALLVVAATQWSIRPAGRERVMVALSAARGVPVDAPETVAPSGRLLTLTIDLTQLPPFPEHRLEVADATGKAVWHSAVRAEDGKIVSPIPHGLDRGVYFVRLSGVSGVNGAELLREYALRVE